MSDQQALIISTFIGAGGFGSVYHARWKGRPVAVKKFAVTKSEAQVRTDILQEIHLLERLRDRHIIQFYGSEYHEGLLVLIMDHAEGGSLKDAILRGRLTNWETRTRIVQEIAHGLGYIHQEGILHRDLKSGNVLLTKYMEVRLCDFGLAMVKTTSVSKSSGSDMARKGTLRWMAPELLGIRPKYSTKSDMYALGMVMWEMAANSTTPFTDQLDNNVVIQAVERGEREVLPDDTPPDYRQWVEQCWEHDPSKRPEARVMTKENNELVISNDIYGAGSTVIFTEDILRLSISSKPSMTVESTSKSQESETKHNPLSSAPVSGRHESSQLSRVQSLLDKANNGDGDAQLALGKMYASGDGVDKDTMEAFIWYFRAAKQGLPKAQWRLGKMFYFGWGVSESDIDAASWYRKAADQGHARAQLQLGNMYTDGQGVDKSYEMAVSWYRKAADQGNVEAQFNLAVMYADGQGVARSYEMAVSWYRKAAEQGYADAQFNLGNMYENGRGVDKSYGMAVSWYRKAADQDNVEAQFNLALMYADGQGVSQSDEMAFSWYQKAAEQGYADAQLNLGNMYESGRGVKKSYEMAVSWYRKAADQGDVEAQFNLALMYADGQGVARSDEMAVSWYRKAADQGDSDAQCGLGGMYADGRGVDMDDEMAVSWYRKAAKQGHARAQFKLGVHYEDGRGVKRSNKMAFSWYRKAADQEHARAQRRLGDCYRYGRGVAQDLQQAIILYSKAAENGHKGARKALKYLGEE